MTYSIPQLPPSEPVFNPNIHFNGHEQYLLDHITNLEETIQRICAQVQSSLPGCRLTDLVDYRQRGARHIEPSEAVELMVQYGGVRTQSQLQQMGNHERLNAQLLPVDTNGSSGPLSIYALSLRHAFGNERVEELLAPVAVDVDVIPAVTLADPGTPFQVYRVKERLYLLYNTVQPNRVQYVVWASGEQDEEHSYNILYHPGELMWVERYPIKGCIRLPVLRDALREFFGTLGGRYFTRSEVEEQLPIRLPNHSDPVFQPYNFRLLLATAIEEGRFPTLSWGNDTGYNRANEYNRPLAFLVTLKEALYSVQLNQDGLLSFPVRTMKHEEMMEVIDHLVEVAGILHPEWIEADRRWREAHASKYVVAHGVSLE